MSRMFRLIKNEFIKTVRKTSTIIALALVILLAIGLVVVAKIAQVQSERYNFDFGTVEDDISYYQSMIDDAEAHKESDPAYKQNIEMYQFLIDNKITDDWEYEAIADAFSTNTEEVTAEDGSVSYQVSYVYSDEQRDKVKSFVVAKDWKGYYNFLIDKFKAESADPNTYWEYQYRVDNGVAPPAGHDDITNWKNQCIFSVSSAKQQLASLGADADESDTAQLKDEIAVNMYRLNNNCEVNVADSVNYMETGELNFWTVLSISVNLLTIVGLLMILIAGSSISSEFSDGTIKFLLINPVKRWKILMSKYFNVIFIGYIMMFVFFLVVTTLSCILFGTSQLGAEYITSMNGEVQTTSGILLILRNYLLGSVSIVVMATLAFAISSVTKSSALAICVSVFSLLSGAGIVAVLKEALNQDWARFFIFANMDLAAVANGTTGFAHHTIGFAVAVIVVHMIVFLLTAWDGFTKKEV